MKTLHNAPQMGDNPCMAPNHDIPRPAVALLERSGVGAQAIDNASPKAMRGLAAIQSLLLSAYTPAGAATWLRTPSDAVGGGTPIVRLIPMDDDAIKAVLAAARDRIAA